MYFFATGPLLFRTIKENDLQKTTDLHQRDNSEWQNNGKNVFSRSTFDFTVGKIAAKKTLCCTALCDTGTLSYLEIRTAVIIRPEKVYKILFANASHIGAAVISRNFSFTRRSRSVVM